MDRKHSTLSSGPTTYGTTREYICDQDTVTQGDPRITCQEDFTWSYTEFYCLR